MNTPLQITYRDMAASSALETRIREAVARLESHVGPLISCRVAVEAPSPHHRHGGVFRVLVDVAVPGREIVVGNGAGERLGATDAHTAVRATFRAATRLLEEHARIRRDEVIRHDREMV